MGGSPQGTLIGQLLYCGSSDVAASEIPEGDKFKYIDDMEVPELVCLAGVLWDYNFLQHIASEVGIDLKFLAPSTFKCKAPLITWLNEHKKTNEDK